MFITLSVAAGQAPGRAHDTELGPALRAYRHGAADAAMIQPGNGTSGTGSRTLLRKRTAARSFLNPHGGADDVCRRPGGAFKQMWLCHFA